MTTHIGHRNTKEDLSGGVYSVEYIGKFERKRGVEDSRHVIWKAMSEHELLGRVFRGAYVTVLGATRDTRSKMRCRQLCASTNLS
jgi:hypothetical protein